MRFVKNKSRFSIKPYTAVPCLFFGSVMQEAGDNNMHHAALLIKVKRDYQALMEEDILKGSGSLKTNILCSNLLVKLTYTSSISNV